MDRRSGLARLSRHATDRTNGFSLLELIAVLAILAIVMALVIPGGRSGGGRAVIAGAAASLASCFRIAKAESLRNSVDRTVTLDFATGQYWSDAEPRPRVLDRRIEVTILDDGLEWTGAARRLRFRPDGTATGATFVLTDGSREARIVVDWLTGATRSSLGR